MHIYCDESGNTGADLLSPEQPLFALAATSLSADLCRSLLEPLRRQRQQEVKYSRLKGTASGQRALLQFFASPEITPASTKLLVADKRYYVITHLVDKLIEPPVYEAGQDLYAGDAHVGLVNIWYYAGNTIFPGGHWDRVMHAFVAAIRQRSAAAYLEFDRTLLAAAATATADNADLVTGLMLAHGRLPEFLENFDREVFDPAVDVFINMINKWMAAHAGMIDVTHDRSKPLKHSEAFLRSMMKPLPPRLIGYGTRQAELPLRVSRFEFADSAALPQLQVADLVAGAAVDGLLAWSGSRPTSGYHAALKATGFPSLIVDGMMPSTDFGRKNEPLPGQVSLVDGAARFFEEAEDDGHEAK